MVEFDHNKKRQGFDYRNKYLEHNPGIFGKFYICSQCGKRITKNQMEVDHIIPNSKWYAPNRVFNCVAACIDCNRWKSDKMGWCTVRGILFKVLEEIYVLLHRLILLLYTCICFTLYYVIDLFVNNIGSRNPKKILLTILCLLMILIHLVCKLF